MKKFNTLIPLEINNFFDSIPDSKEKEVIKGTYIKSLPKMVEIINVNDFLKYGKCPNCKKAFIESYGKYKYCPDCGQKLYFRKK